MRPASERLYDSSPCVEVTEPIDPLLYTPYEEWRSDNIGITMLE
jgi:hypothetical protein